MKLIGATLGIFVMCAVGAGAQEVKTTTKTKQKIEIKDGKDVHVEGCLERNPNGGYMITNDVRGFKYALVTDRGLDKYVGDRVEVHGLATDRGDAKVQIESKVGTTGEVGGTKIEDSNRKVKTTMEGDLGLQYLGVKSVKRINRSCR